VIKIKTTIITHYLPCLSNPSNQFLVHIKACTLSARSLVRYLLSTREPILNVDLEATIVIWMHKISQANNERFELSGILKVLCSWWDS